MSEDVLQIPHINKYISPETQMTTLFTPDFGKYTGVSTETLNVILKDITDDVRVGGEFTCTVSDIITSSQPVAIEDDSMIISYNFAREAFL